MAAIETRHRGRVGMGVRRADHSQGKRRVEAILAMSNLALLPTDRLGYGMDTTSSVFVPATDPNCRVKATVTR